MATPKKKKVNPDEVPLGSGLVDTAKKKLKKRKKQTKDRLDEIMGTIKRNN